MGMKIPVRRVINDRVFGTKCTKRDHDDQKWPNIVIKDYNYNNQILLAMSVGCTESKERIRGGEYGHQEV